MAHISYATHNQYQDRNRQHLLPQSQIVVLIVEPTLSAHQHSEYEKADGLRMSSLHQAPVIGSHLSVSQVTVGILQEGAVLMTIIHISIHLTQCRCIHLPSRNEGVDFYRLDKEEGNHPPEPFGRKITQWDENQSIDGIGEEDIAIKKGGVHDTEHCQEEHSPGESSRKAISPLLLVIIHNKEAQSEEQGKDAIHLSRQQQSQHICHPIITTQRISMLYASIVHIEMLHRVIENNTCHCQSSQGISHVNTTVFQS